MAACLDVALAKAETLAEGVPSVLPVLVTGI